MIMINAARVMGVAALPLPAIPACLPACRMK